MQQDNSVATCTSNQRTITKLLCRILKDTRFNIGTSNESWCVKVDSDELSLWNKNISQIKLKLYLTLLQNMIYYLISISNYLFAEGHMNKTIQIKRNCYYFFLQFKQTKQLPNSKRKLTKRDELSFFTVLAFPKASKMGLAANSCLSNSTLEEKANIIY